MTIKIKYHDPEMPRIKKISVGDWIDLRAAEDVEMSTGELRYISLGVSMQLPEGYEAHILPRSSTFKNYGLLMVNSMGVVDNMFCGDEDVWRFPALAMRDTIIHKGDRICQFRIEKVMDPVEFIEVEHLDNPTRGGFGSTGVV